ncbi:MAG: tol-pal system protein YbgF [Gammaproteobacteria bacterium]
MSTIALALVLAGAQPAAVAQGSLQERVARIERLLNNNTMLQMLDEIRAMRSDLRSLRGEVELQAHNAGRAKAQNKAQYVDLDRRLTRIESLLSAGTAELSPGTGEHSTAGGTGTDPSGHAHDADAGSQSGGDAVYEAAFEQLKSGRYSAAAAGFQAYLRDHPNGRYGANAQYWLGETHYVEQRYAKALETFGQVIARYPRSDKAADALLKSGYILQEQGQRDRARQMLNDVLSRHPNSRAAELARERLAQLGN